MQIPEAPAIDQSPATSPVHTVLWTMRKQGRLITAEIVRLNDRWELRLFAQGAMFMWRRFLVRGSAVAYADFIRHDFGADRWV